MLGKLTSKPDTGSKLRSHGTEAPEPQMRMPVSPAKGIMPMNEAPSAGDSLTQGAVLGTSCRLEYLVPPRALWDRP